MRRGPYRGLPWAIAALALAFACMAALVLGLAGALPAHAAADEPLRAGSLQAQEPSSATNDWLGELRFGTRTDPSDERFAGYELEPELDAAVHEYTLYVPDTEGGIYAWGTSLLASSTTSMSTDAVYAAFTDSRGNEQDVNLGAYGSSGSFVYLTRCISRGSSTNELRIYSPGGTADYTVHVRRVASLSSLVAQVVGQESELFSSGATEFDLPVPLNCKGEVLTLTAQPYFPPTAGANDDYVVKIAGEEVQAGEAWTHVLEGGAEDIAVEVSYEGNRSTAYTVHVMPTDTGGAARFSFEVEEEGQEPPVDAEVKVFNAHGVQVMPDESDPTHFSGLFVGSEYTYTASAEGWRSVRGSFTAQSGESPVAVLFAERSKGRYLDDLRVYPNSSGSVAGNYPLRRAEELDASFDATVYAVSYSSQQTSNACYLSAVLSDNAPEGARIRVSAWGLDGEEHSMVLPDSTEDLPVRRSLGKNIFQQGPKRAVYWIEVGIGDDVERYAVVVERDLQLAGLSVTDETGMGNLIEQPFQRSVHDYDVSVLKSVPFLLVTAAPYEGLEGAQVLVDGMEAGGTAFVELYEERLQDVRVELEYDETYDDPALAGLAYTSTGLYTVHVERLVPVDVTIVTDPEDAIACVYDRKGDRVQSAGDGRTFLGLYEGREYTYSVTRYGCKGEKGTFVAEDGLVVHVTLDSAETVHPELEGMEWWNYRNNYENNGTTQATTPDSPANAALKWQVSIGGDYGSSATPPLVGNGFVFTAAGKFIYKLDKTTGEVVAVSDELAGDVAFALNSMTYAEGMLFVQVGRGRIQAVSATTLRSLWVSESIGGQTLSPITYRSGYLYTGTWNSETKPGEFVCMTVTDEDPDRPDEVKTCAWRWSRSGGFYWAGAYVDENSNYVVFGSDDGSPEGSATDTAALFSVKPTTGEEIDRIEGLLGDVRTSMVYDGGYVYFATKSGYLYRVKMNDDGTFGKVSTLLLGGAATASPVVYNGRVYVGVCGEGGQFSADGGHCFAVVTSDEAGLHLAYKVEAPGYPQASALVTTAYAGKDFDVNGEPDGRVYVYFTYNARPGGIAMLVDEPGQREGEVVELWAPEGPQQQYCISPICSDGEGTLYYKNDSGYLFAVTANEAYLLDAELIPDSGEARWDEEYDAGRLKYHVMVPNEATSVAVKLKVPTGRQVKVNGEPYAAGMKLPLSADGSVTTVDVTVSYRGKTRTYLMEIEPLGTNAALSELFCGTSNNALQMQKRLAISPEFDPEVAAYETDECDADRKFVNLWAVPASAYAKVEVEGVGGVSKINVFHNATGSYGRTRYAVYFDQDEAVARVHITVTAGDGVTQRAYDVAIRRPDTYAPKIEDAQAQRLSAEDVAVLFNGNETGTYVWAVTGPDDPQPPRPDAVAPEGSGGTGVAALAAGPNRIDLAGIGPNACAVWIWAIDEAGNATASPVRVPVAEYREFTWTLSVDPAVATVSLTDAQGAEVPLEGTGAKRSATLAEGNVYRLKVQMTGHTTFDERFTASAEEPVRSVVLKDLRSTDSKLSGLYVSSSAKWRSGLQKIAPDFAKETTRYASSYNGQRTHMYLWPVASDAKATVKVYAVGGVRASTVAKDETIACEPQDGHACWKVYFADNVYEAQVRVHVIAEDGSATDYFVTLDIRDATPPALKKVTASRISPAKASVVFKSDEEGRYFYAVAAKGSKAPAVKLDGPGSKMIKGTTTVNVEGLLKGAYVVYIVGVDAAGNPSDVLEVPVPDSRKSSSAGSGSSSGSGGSGSGSASDGRHGISGAAGGGTVYSGSKSGTSSSRGGTGTGTIRHEGPDGTGQGSDASSASRSGASAAASDAAASGQSAGKDGSASGRSAGKDEAASGASGGVDGAPGDGDGPGASASGGGESQPDGAGASASELAHDLFGAHLALAKAFFALAGLGILYLIFWSYSSLKRKRQRDAAMQGSYGNVYRKVEGKDVTR